MGISIPLKEANFCEFIFKSYETKQYQKGLKASNHILKRISGHGEILSIKGLTLNCLDRKVVALRRGLKNDLKSHVCWHVHGLREYSEATKCYKKALQRAQAEVGRADGQAEFETGLGTEENGRKRWSGEQDMKKATALEDSSIYPIMRVYRDDLCTLEITGDAQAWQAIEAMAADGGLTAAEELSKRRPLMTVETIIPRRSEDHSTASTKLLAPTHLVTRAAKTIWMHKKISMSSGNALARAFQRVVLQRLLAFDIRIRSPGTARDMANLANEKEDAVVASLESRDAKVLEGLSEVLSSYSMANIKDTFNQRFSGQSRQDKRFKPWKKPEWIWALNKAIGVRSLSQSEIREQAKRIFDEKNVIGEVNRTHQAWWPTPSVSLPSNILPEQGAEYWSAEFIPIHKLQIDTSKIKVTAKGWQRTKTEQVLELNLTHAQLVDLADLLDLYYEDKYTTPTRTLGSGVDLKISHLSQSGKDSVDSRTVMHNWWSTTCWSTCSDQIQNFVLN